MQANPGNSATAAPPDEWLQIGEVAAEIKSHRSLVYRLIRSGELPASALGSGPRARLRVRRSDLEHFLLDPPEPEDAA